MSTDYSSLFCIIKNCDEAKCDDSKCDDPDFSGKLCYEHDVEFSEHEKKIVKHKQDMEIFNPGSISGVSAHTEFLDHTKRLDELKAKSSEKA